jgi:crotonobetainyl-CoA:carnitine CoA-transferase CaiB-like acyl-CoA transferase
MTPIPQVQARALVVGVEHATPGAVRTLGSASDLGHARRVRSGAPVHGQHTREVLRTHGFADAEIEALVAEGAIAVTD